MTVYQCPRCELRFGRTSELRGHLDNEHRTFRSTAASVEDDLLGACHCNHRGHRNTHKKLQTRR
jgi:hypothetical protein